MKNNNIEFEIIYSNKKRILFFCGVVCVVALLVAIVSTRTLAKYRVAQSMPLYNATVNYTPYDFKMVAMYQESDTGEYVSIDTVPSSGYTLNEDMSYCEVGDVRDTNIQIVYEGGQINFLGMTTKGTKCYLYFDEKATIKDTLLTYYPTVLTRSDFSTTLTNITTGIIYQAEDDDGTTYYFAGAPTDNWVSFAGFYWRIIRINGDGSIRLIYQGISANTTGTSTQLSSTSVFNSSYDSEYVGYMYTSGEVHGLGNNSVIKGVLDTWYSNNLLSYRNYISTNAGFCGDRSLYNGTGIGAASTDYAAYDRLHTKKAPTFICGNNSDLYTASSSKGNKSLAYPIGLITADEVAYAGGVIGRSNSSYYLYTGNSYWTMTPYAYFTMYNSALVLNLSSNGALSSAGVSSSDGIRPVINLRSDIELSGTGTSTDPFQIVGA